MDVNLRNSHSPLKYLPGSFVFKMRLIWGRYKSLLYDYESHYWKSTSNVFAETEGLVMEDIHLLFQV